MCGSLEPQSFRTTMSVKSEGCNTPLARFNLTAARVPPSNAVDRMEVVLFDSESRFK